MNALRRCWMQSIAICVELPTTEQRNYNSDDRYK